MIVTARVWSLLVAALLALAMTLTAHAHGPTRQKVTETVEINAPAAKVWEVIGNFQDMDWHPTFSKTEGANGNEVGATRKLTVKAGGVIDETLTKYKADARLLKYEITKVDVKVFPVNNYSSTLSVAEKDGKSVVTWKGAFYRGYLNNDPPPELNEEAAIKAVTALYRSGLDALKTKLESGS